MAVEQRMLHIVTEALAIPLGIFLIWLGFKVREKKWIKAVLIIAGIGNLLIDGFMLWSWLR